MISWPGDNELCKYVSSVVIVRDIYGDMLIYFQRQINWFMLLVVRGTKDEQGVFSGGNLGRLWALEVGEGQRRSWGCAATEVRQQ